MPDLSMTQGNDLRVDYEAENFGDLTYDPSGDTDIRLVQSSTTEDSDPATVKPDAVVDGSLFWTDVPSGTHTVIVETDDGTDSIGVEATSAIDTTNLLHQYNYQAETGFSDGNSVGTLTDQEGSNNLSGNATYRTSGINGNAAGEYDGTDDDHESGSEASTTGGYTIAFVVEPSSVPSSGAIVPISNGNQSNGQRIEFQADGNFDWVHNGEARAGGVYSYSTNTSLIIVGAWDGSTLTVDVNKSQATSESLSNLVDPSGDLAVGYQHWSASEYWDGFIGEVLIYDGHKSGSERNSITDTLASRWDISV